ncbi:MAG: ECF transporter S component [Bacillota bacterium]|nr:ECF transporter S component [Bacillota bacterium]
MSNSKTRKIVIVALFTALVAVATMAIKIPTINGYIHLGDTMVYLCGIFLGPIYGPIAAGVGSFLADILSGYAIWSMPSLLIKALDALVFGLIFKKVIFENVTAESLVVKYVLSLLIGGSIMVAGYFVTSVVIYSYAGALSSVIPNIVQAIGGGIIAYPIFIALKNQKIINKFDKNYKQ